MSVSTYKRRSLKAGWSRVDLLLEIYDRAINSIKACAIADETGDTQAFADHSIAAQKALLAIHSGLKPDEDEVAFNIARLLLFATDAMEKREFDSAVKVLEDLRGGFAAVAEEVNQLEREGTIPGFPDENGFVY
ncbi:MAG: hypothetical protein AAFU85_14425 [Planctomycetota bacterium]